MTRATFEGRTHAPPIEVDGCKTCHLLWFDRWESIQLAPRGILELFQYIGGTAGHSSTPMKSNFNCIRCSIRLDPTRDLQRTTAFTYWRCGMGHGKLISFHQFLREKNFIRTPSPLELARLRDTIKQISCSQCGAPINLTTDSACSHCRAPIAMIDPESVARQVKELSEASLVPDSAASTNARNAIVDAQFDALFELERQQRIQRRGMDADLVSLGAKAIGAAIGIWLGTR